MKGASTILLAAMVLALAAGTVQGQKFIRHQFNFLLKDGVDASQVPTILQKVVAGAPAAARPISSQIGADLGISKQLYSNVTAAKVQPVQVGFGGYIDFKDFASTKAFFTYLLVQPAFLQLNLKYFQSVQSQQLYTNGKYPAKGTTVYRHAFSYSFPAGATKATNAKKAADLWTKWIAASPVKPVSVVLGADLGISSKLYPIPNLDFSGSLDFKSKADLVKFWAFLFAQKEFKDWSVKGPATAELRVQYVAKY